MNYLTCRKSFVGQLLCGFQKRFTVLVWILTACRTLSFAGRLLNFDKILRGKKMKKTQKCDTKEDKKHKFYAKMRRVYGRWHCFARNWLDFVGFSARFGHWKSSARFHQPNYSQKSHFSQHLVSKTPLRLYHAQLISTHFHLLDISVSHSTRT